MNFENTITLLANNNLLSIEKANGKITFIDVFDIIKSIKQLEFILLKLQKIKFKKSEKLPIQVIVPNKFIKTMLGQYLLKLNSNSRIKISTNFLNIKSNSVVFIFLDTLNKEHVILLKRLIAKKIFVFFTLNSFFGTYNMFINEPKLKKLFFFITLLDKILINEKN